MKEYDIKSSLATCGRNAVVVGTKMVNFSVRTMIMVQATKPVLNSIPMNSEKIFCLMPRSITRSIDIILFPEPY